jgi:hypothetical protein
MNVNTYYSPKEIQMNKMLTEPLEDKLRRLKLQKKALAFKAKVLTAARKNSIANEFLAANDTLVMYVHDKFGFKKGVVIATGPGVIGWSLVSREDYETVHLDIEQIPKLAGLIHNPEGHLLGLDDEEALPAADALDLLVKDNAFKAWAASGGWIERPLFDKDTGLTFAINKMKALEAATGPDKGLDLGDVDIPRDRDLREVVETMILRSHRYFHDKPHAFETRTPLPTRSESHRDN